MDATVVGYALRVEALVPEWDDARREGFLLDPKGPLPRSVDPYVWPEVPGVPRDGGTLEFDLAALKRATAGLPGVLMAWGVLGRDAPTVVTPREPDPQWQLLGFDVTGRRA